MTDGDLAQLASRIVASRHGRRRLPHLEALESLEDGYRLQEAANLRLEPELGPRVGHKIGGTTAAMRAYIHVPEPIAGEVFESTVLASGTRLKLRSYVRPGVESEIAVRLGRGLPPRAQPYGRDEVTSAVEALMPAIEIVDDRYEDFKTAGAPTLIADNAFNAACVLGEPVRGWQGLDLPSLRAHTLVDGVEVASGLAEVLMGHPMDALAWLATRRSASGRGLEAGAFVSLGSITAVQWPSEPASFRVEVERLGAVEVSFA